MMKFIIAVILCSFDIASTRIINGIEDRNLAMENEGYFDGDMAGVYLDDRNAMTASGRLWPNGKVYYVVDKSLAQVKSRITRAMAEYTKKTKGCITFEEGQGKGKYVYFSRLRGCHSIVGMGKKKQNLSLGMGCASHGIIIHEIGHALGLFHEQNRSDRDKYIKVHFENISKKKKGNFHKRAKTMNYLFTSYDYGSIMQYGRKAFSINGKITMEPLYPTKVLGQRRGLSAKDVITVMALYNCIEMNDSVITLPSKKRLLFECKFSSGFCIFQNKVKQAAFKRVGNGSNAYLTANISALDHRLVSTPLELHGNGTICIHLKYRCHGNVTIREFGVIYGPRLIHKMSLRHTGSKWITIGKTFKKLPSHGSLRFYVDARPEDGGSSFDLKYFSYSQGSC